MTKLSSLVLALALACGDGAPAGPPPPPGDSSGGDSCATDGSSVSYSESIADDSDGISMRTIVALRRLFLEDPGEWLS